MTDQLSVSFGPILAGTYHMAIESTFQGTSELVQAQPVIALKDASTAGVIEQALTPFGAPFGALEGRIKGVSPTDGNFTLPSVPIFTGNNLYDAQKVIEYNANKITAAQKTYNPLSLNSNSFVNTLLDAFGVAVPRFGSISYDQNGNAYLTPASRTLGLINIGVDSGGNPDHGFHQLGANPFAPQTSDSSPVQGGADPGVPSSNPPNGPASTGAPESGPTPPADNSDAPGASPSPRTGLQAPPATDGISPDNTSIGIGGFGFQGGANGYSGFTGYGGYQNGIPSDGMTQEQDPSRMPGSNISPASTAAPAPGPVSDAPTDDPGHINGQPHDFAPGPGYGPEADTSGQTASGDTAANQGSTGYNGGQSVYGGYDGQGDPDGAGAPIILDLSGQGIALTQLTSSNQFEVGEDNDQHRTAWAGAGAGSAVLFVDPNGDNCHPQRRPIRVQRLGPLGLLRHGSPARRLRYQPRRQARRRRRRFRPVQAHGHQPRRHHQRRDAGSSRHHLDRPRGQQRHAQLRRRLVDRRRDHLHQGRRLDRHRRHRHLRTGCQRHRARDPAGHGQPRRLHHDRQRDGPPRGADGYGLIGTISALIGTPLRRGVLLRKIRAVPSWGGLFLWLRKNLKRCRLAGACISHALRANVTCVKRRIV